MVSHNGQDLKKAPSETAAFILVVETASSAVRSRQDSRGWELVRMMGRVEIPWADYRHSESAVIANG